MRLLFYLFKCLLVVLLCVWLVVPCDASDVLCLSGENQPKQRRRNESFTNRGVADEAQNRAYLSPTVFIGTLKSVLVQRDGTVRAWFAIDTLLKMPDAQDDRKRTVRMANYTRLYERNRYTRDYATTTVPAVRLKSIPSVRTNNYPRLYTVPGMRMSNYPPLSSVPSVTPDPSSVLSVRTNTYSSIPDTRTNNYPHMSSASKSRTSNYPRLSRTSNSWTSHYPRQSSVSNSRLRNYPRLSTVSSTRTSNYPPLSSVSSARTNTPVRALLSSYTKTVPLTINTLNWTVSDPPLLLGPFQFSTRTLSKRVEDTEVVYYSHGRCVLEVNQDNLLLGRQYVVFGVPSDRQAWPSLTASALPIPNDKRIFRAVKKVLCTGCAKPPGIEGLQNVKVEEGSRARLRCHLAGNPIPWVEWFKDGKQVTTRGRIRVKTRRRTSRLVIRRSRYSDRGVYQCRAGNVVQKEVVQATASLVVIRKRKKPPPTTTTSLTTSTSTQSSPWTTEPCRETNFCNNGGTCVFYRDVQEYVCHCADGYVGLRCDYKDVRLSVGEVKSLDSSRLLIVIVVLFLVFFCLNWICLGICWLCCFRDRVRGEWEKFQEMAPLRKLFRRKSEDSSEDAVSVNVAQM